MKKEKVYKHNGCKNNMIIPGDSSELPDDFLKVVVFIDNAYLIRVKNYFFKEKFKYNLKEFILNIAKSNKLIVRIFFYNKAYKLRNYYNISNHQIVSMNPSDLKRLLDVYYFSLNFARYF